MKNRILFALGSSLLLSLSSSHAAIFANFSGLANGDALVPSGTGPGYDGWTQTEANPAALSPISYGQAVAGTPGVAVGGQYATPEADSFQIQHTVVLPFANSSTTATFTVGRAIADPVQNSFEIGVYGSGNANLFSLVIGRTGDPDTWNMFYRTGAGSDILLSSTYAISTDQVTNMTLNFTANGSDVDFDLTLVSGATTLNFNSASSGVDALTPLTGLASDTYDSLRVSMLHVPGTDPITEPFDAYGTNYIALTDIQAVPEPASLLLSSLAGGALLLRRRRRA